MKKAVNLLGIIVILLSMTLTAYAGTEYLLRFMIKAVLVSPECCADAAAAEYHTDTADTGILHKIPETYPVTELLGCVAAVGHI